MKKNRLLEWFESLSIGILIIVSLIVILEIAGSFLGSQTVSLIPLISNPWAYHAMKIETRGFLKLARDSDYLCLDQENYKKRLENFILLDIDKSQLTSKTKGALNEQYVIVEGTFYATSKKYIYRNKGEIRKITRLLRLQSIE